MSMIVPSIIFAAPKGEKVGSVRGVNLPAYKSSGSCNDDAKWGNVKIGKFRMLDCFKTGDGGSVYLELKENNSTFSIAENSIVNIKDLVEKDESGAFRIKLDIQKGYMDFKIQKNRGHEVQFQTGTAAASIRGTEGVIGGNDKVFFAGLKNGKLMVKPNGGDSLSVGGGETVLGRESFVVLQLQSSGDLAFAKILMEMLSDTSKSMNELKTSVLKADSSFQVSQKVSIESSKAPAQSEKVAEKINAPSIRYSSYDSLRCVANVAVSGIQKGTEARLSALMDGSPISEESVERNMPKRVSLRSGVHEYEFVVENEGGRSSVRKTLGCYPMKAFSVKVFGKKNVRLTVPPPPPHLYANVENTITQTLQFQIRVPENDPSVLNKVTVRQNGKVILQERLSQIQNLDYQISVELKRNLKNRFDIEVVHKSGYVVKTTKVYEVGK